MRKLGLFLAVVGSLALTACGGDDGSDAGTRSVVQLSEQTHGPECGVTKDYVKTADAYAPVIAAYNQKHNTGYDYHNAGYSTPVAAPAPTPVAVDKYSTYHNNNTQTYELAYSDAVETLYTNVSGGDDIKCTKYQAPVGTYTNP